MLRKYPLFIILFFVSTCLAAQEAKIQALLDSLRNAGNFTGLSVAFIKGTGPLQAFASGFNDKEKNKLLSVNDRMLQGSVGKTYVSAIALNLVRAGRLQLDRKVSFYLGNHEWYKRVPNAEDITVRMLMNHTSGVMRYEFKPDFLRDLTAQPSKAWKPEELVSYVLDEEAPFAAGDGWDYSDTNYILLGMIIEQITGKLYYDLLVTDLTEPYGLTNTFPSDGRRLNGLAQGYAGASNEFGGKDRVIDDDGLFIINPQFEWTGGGVYSTTGDLAKWGKLLYEGKVVDTSLLLSSAVPAKLGKDTKYGLGVIIRQTALGTSYGHSGFFPGYMTELAYFPALKMCVALQCNSSDFKNLKLSPARCLVEIARIAGAQ
jgi:D-alanyl-D-alanine carboxypeptidase